MILDLGSEENAQLAREIRALGVYSEIYAHDITKDELMALPNVKGIILNGGPNHVVDGVEIEVTYEDVKESVSDVLAVKKDNFATEEEYKEELSKTLDNALTDNGIELESEVVDGIADYIDENYSDFIGELTDEQFNDIILEYYDVYLDYINNGTLPEGIPEDILEQIQ